MIQKLRSGTAAWLLLVLALDPVRAAAQPNANRVMEPVPAQRPIRARPVPQADPAAQPGVPAVPSTPVDRNAGTERATVTEEGLVNLDFEDVELATVIDTIARLTNRNFVYDDRVRGRVTIVSPTPVPVDQAYTVFESMLQVKGFTTVEAPGGVTKVIPIRDAKETSVDTRGGTSRTTPDTDRFVTRLIPLSYIDAEQISNTIKPLVSKEAALVAYQPTNTIILTDSASNIRRILSILEAIDVETFKQELALIRLQYADATVVAEQLSELFGVEVVGSTARAPGVAQRVRARPQPVVPGQPTATTSPEAAQRGQVRIITDERTNSLVALASRSTLEEIRDFIRRIDVPVEGGGRIQVYYLKHADAEELAETLSSLLGGGGGGGGAAGQQGITPQLAGAVADIASGVGTVTADPATNSLLIQASPEGYQALLRVIEQLDIARPQVLVEALIMEVTVGDGQELGFNAVVRLLGGDQNLSVSSRTDTASEGVLGSENDTSGDGVGSGLTNLARGLAPVLAGPGGFLARIAIRDGNDDIIRGVIRAAANDSSINVLSAPHILTSDNEEAEILVGDNIPIITSRVQSAGTVTVDASNLATSVNVERQDIGVTLRVTPQITEGETMRLDIFQEITALNSALQQGVGDPNQVGPALSNRRIENSVVIKDGETVVIGGLISDDYTDTVSKIPWLGDVPVLGWLFKSTSTQLTKRNLLVFLTPRVIRSAEDLEKQSIVKREEFRRRSEQALEKHPSQQPDELDQPIGVLGDPRTVSGQNPAQGAVEALDQRYPLERMLEIERSQSVSRARAREAAARPAALQRYLVLGGVFADPGVAQSTLTRLVDAGYEGTLVSSRASGRVLLELRVGPFADLPAAERAAEALRRGYALAPQVMVQRSEDIQP